LTAATATNNDLRLQFAPADIPRLTRRYMDRDAEEDEKAVAAGARIRGGDFSRDNLLAIFRWKTKGRGVSRLASNSDDEIADALRLALDARAGRSAIAVLTGLYGVDVPVASAILTAMKPDQYTVIDFRTLEALGSISKDRSVQFYLDYLGFCRHLAAEHHVTLRDLDRAMWQWSNDR
jgi:hypothetical protein